MLGRLDGDQKKAMDRSEMNESSECHHADNNLTARSTEDNTQEDSDAKEAVSANSTMKTYRKSMDVPSPGAISVPGVTSIMRPSTVASDEMSCDYRAVRPGASRVYPSHYCEADNLTEASLNEYAVSVVHSGVPTAGLTDIENIGHESVIIGVVVEPEADVSLQTDAPAAVTAEVVKGFYVKRRRIVSVTVMGLALTTCIVGLAVGIAFRPTAPTEEESRKGVVRPTTLERLAIGLPDITVRTLQSELSESTRSQTWYKDDLWTSTSSGVTLQTPQGKAWKWLTSDFKLQPRSLVDITERFAMATLYYATNGPNWKNNTNWLSNTEDLCAWWSNAQDNPVTYVDFLAFCLGTKSGKRYRTKELLLTANGLDGSIPPEMALFSGLTTVRFDSNSLRGSIPDAVWSSWESVDNLQLYENDFTGTIPTLLGLLTNARNIFLDGNNFSGSLPSQIAALTSKLNRFSVASNSLSGRIPTEMAKLTAMLTLELSKNRFTGPLPSGLANLEDVYTLSFDKNQLSGTIPPAFGRLQQLTWFDMSHNNLLSGLVPSQLGRLGRLENLYMNNCSFAGSLPSQMAKLTLLRNLDISGTRISGTLPEELGELSQLTTLRVFETQLSGSVPASICQAAAHQDATAGLVVDCQQIACDCNCTCV